MPSHRTRGLLEARMRDVRRHQKKEASGAVLGRKFKEAFQALGNLSGALMISGNQELAHEVDDVTGHLRKIQKEMES